MTNRPLKEAVRNNIRNRLSQLTDREKREQETAICIRLLECLPHHPTAICAYAPLSDEPDISRVLAALLQRDIPLFLPRFDDQKVTFHRITSLDALRPGTFGIAEPPRENPAPDPMAISHVLVPGRAFDYHMNRLGRGKAGYDVWIRRQRKVHPKTQFWGIAFEEQIVDAVPVDGHDERMDRVITPAGNIGVLE